MSSIVDYFTSGVTNTYDETIDFWSSDNKFDRTVDAVKFTASNPDLFVEQLNKNVDKSVKEFDTAVNQDKNKVIVLVVLGAAAYYYFSKGGKK